MANQPITFSNASESMVKSLKEVFSLNTNKWPILNEVRVATRKYASSNKQASNQVIVSPTGSTLVSDGTVKFQGYNILIWAKTYEEAEVLATLTQAYLQAIKGINGIRKVEIDMGYIDATESSLEEQRWLTCTALFTGQNFN